LCAATFDNVSVSSSDGTTPPVAPGALTASAASSTRINLAWSDNAINEDGFEIERSTDDSAFSRVATLAANATSYPDTGLNPSTTHHYRVRAFNTAGDSPFSNTASATTAGSGGALPEPWQNQDVGLAALPGGASQSGRDIWDTADAFHFLHQSWDGDGEILARVTGMENTAAWAKAGVMFRETLEAGAANALMFVTPDNGVGLQSRAAAGEQSSFTRGPGLTAPAWIRLVRTGSELAGYASSDGATWNLVDKHTVTMGATARVGLAVTSHDNSALNTATIDGVVVRTPQIPLMLGLREMNWTVKPAVPRLSCTPPDVEIENRGSSRPAL
jgi:hypothetical protein